MLFKSSETLATIGLGPIWAASEAGTNRSIIMNSIMFEAVHERNKNWMCSMRTVIDIGIWMSVSFFNRPFLCIEHCIDDFLFATVHAAHRCPPAKSPILIFSHEIICQPPLLSHMFCCCCGIYYRMLGHLADNWLMFQTMRTELRFYKHRQFS